MLDAHLHRLGSLVPNDDPTSASGTIRMGPHSGFCIKY